MDIRRYEFFKRLIAVPDIEEIWLYGSRARHDNQELSDIDIAIACPKAEDGTWFDIKEIIENADTLLKIDCVRLDQLGNTALKNSILTQGKCLFMKHPDQRYKITESFAKVGRALSQLNIMLKKPMDPDRSNIDASIKRFEFSIELFWKLLKRLIENKGRQVSFPKDVLREAYAAKMIKDEHTWLSMLEDRNQSAHLYEEELADKIYKNLYIYHPIMQETYDKLHAEFEKSE